jgi:hypothetical protein
MVSWVVIKIGPQRLDVKNLYFNLEIKYKSNKKRSKNL